MVTAVFQSLEQSRPLRVPKLFTNDEYMGIFSEGSLPGQCAAFRRKDLGVRSKLSCTEMTVTTGNARSRSPGGGVGEGSGHRKQGRKAQNARCHVYYYINTAEEGSL